MVKVNSLKEIACIAKGFTKKSFNPYYSLIKEGSIDPTDNSNFISPLYRNLVFLTLGGTIAKTLITGKLPELSDYQMFLKNGFLEAIAESSVLGILYVVYENVKTSFKKCYLWI